MAARRVGETLFRFVKSNNRLTLNKSKQIKLMSSCCGAKQEDTCCGKKDECSQECCTLPHPMAAEVLGVESCEEVPCCTPPNCDTFELGEMRFYYNQFIKYDSDKDGKLSRWELNELYREKYARMLNAADLEKMMREMGLEYCDNLIGFTEYMSHLQKRYSPPYCMQELIQIFDMWDKDSDGRLDWFEFKLAVGFLGYDPDHPDLLCRFEKSDRDYDDMLEFDEFVEAYEGLKELPKRCLDA